MSRLLMSVLSAFLTCVVSAQHVEKGRLVVTGDEAEALWRHQQELGDLYLRAAASRFVVVGLVMTHEGIAERTASSMDSLGGELYTMKVEQTLCRQDDFSLKTTGAKDAPVTIHVFVPVKPFVEGVQEKERMIRGERYLLFLTVPASAQQQQWIEAFGLDPKRVYYRAEQQARGVIPMRSSAPGGTAPPTVPKVLDKVKRLCAAVHEPTAAGKLDSLGQLAASNDPILAREANIAIHALQTMK